MKKATWLLSVLLTVCLLLAGCGQGATNPTPTASGSAPDGSAAPATSAAAGAAKLTIAHQYGMAYAPCEVMKEQKLIEKYYPGVEVEWQILNSGSVINDGVMAGSIDVAYMGIAPFVTGVTKGIPYKLYSGLSAQPMGLNTTKGSLTKLADFKEEDKIALVSYGSIQHIMLAMAAEKELGDPNALDKNIINMAHPDGMQAMVSGSVPAHLTTSPYYNKELEMDNVHEIESVREAFPDDCTIIIGVAANKLYDENKALYDALCKATDEAMTYINGNVSEAAKMLCEREGVSAEVMEGYLKNPGCKYTSKPSGVMDIATFMAKAKFIDKAPADISEIAFDNVKE